MGCFGWVLASRVLVKELGRQAPMRRDELQQGQPDVGEDLGMLRTDTFHLEVFDVDVGIEADRFPEGEEILHEISKLPCTSQAV